MKRSEFELLVSEAMDDIPVEFQDRLENVDVVVDDIPPKDNIGASFVSDEDFLICLYEGVPVTERNDYGEVLSDRICLFQDSIELLFSDENEIREEIKSLIIQEITNHFGMQDN